MTPIEQQEYVFDKEDVYIESDTPTMESDTDPEGVTRYFKKLKDFYNENNWNYEVDDLYIYDAIADRYIPKDELLPPTNCWFRRSDELYELVINNYCQYVDFDSPRNVNHILVIKEDNDYIRYIKNQDGDFIVDNNPHVRYVYNSDEDYVTLFLLDDTYADTNYMIVVLNKTIATVMDNDIYNTKYNPEETDKVWDENDWFYDDPSYSDTDIGMNGENIWYYIKPGSAINVPIEEDDEESTTVGSGFYMEKSAYIGDVELAAGEKYYMSFDIETNFTGKMQIYNTADNAVLTANDKIYEVVRREKQHITQVFISNGVVNPEIRFLIYDFENYPIHAGDYIIVSNIRFVKAYSDNFISQDIPSYDKLQELYRTNEAIYKYLLKLMANESDFNTYNIYKKIYDSLMVSKYNKEAFKIADNRYAETYTEFLENRDAVLYSKLIRFKSLDRETMHKEIADEIIEVTYAIDNYVDTYSYGFLYSYFPAVSANYIQQYITKIINWFKSWKVHLLGINTVYKLGGYENNENIVKILEDQQFRNRYDYEKCNVYIHDSVKINPFDDLDPAGRRYIDNYNFSNNEPPEDKDIYEIIVDNPTPGSGIYRYASPNIEVSDKVRPRDRVRLITRTDNEIRYLDPENEMHIVFNNDDITAQVDGQNILKIDTGDTGFTVEGVGNEFVLTTNETEQQAFANQVIGEINKLSSDYIEWRDILDE
jgi:hypothetical protein